MLTASEDQIFREAYRFFCAHTSPPPASSPAAEAYWQEAVVDMGRVSAAYQHHPLMDGLLMAIYEYLEKQAKEAEK